MEELKIKVDENDFEIGTREILKNIRPNWKNNIKFKVSYTKRLSLSVKKNKFNAY